MQIVLLGTFGDHLGPLGTIWDQNIPKQTKILFPRLITKNIFENQLFRNGSKTNFSEMGLAQLDIYERYTQAVILCLHTWVFRVLLPLYFNSKGPVLVEIAVGIGNILVFQDSDVFGLFWEVIPGSSQEMLLSLQEKRVRILRKKRCYGPN